MKPVSQITDQHEVKKIVNRVSGVTIAVNISLAGIKLLAGIFARSGAMVSDAVHTISDVFTTIIAYIGVRLSRKEPDSKHPYGHDRFECVASILLSGMLFMTGLGIGWSGVKVIFGGNTKSLEIPGLLALVAAAVSIACKEWMYWYTRAMAKKINSSAFMADAWHHRSDALSSVGSLIGIAGARLGLPVLDPIASVIICFFILKVSVDIFRESIRKMTDRACDKKTEDGIRSLILSHAHVLGLDKLSTRVFGDRIYVDAEISVDGNQTLEDAHKVAEEVHDNIEKQYPNIKHIMIHENPSYPDKDKDK
ncbi:MAG: cation diffusion facilitator family transporter [Eubacteriales bacterium]|nr:cation diffusion facilitator family transporter [Eubacteriales bacterium]